MSELPEIEDINIPDQATRERLENPGLSNKGVPIQVKRLAEVSSETNKIYGEKFKAAARFIAR